MKKNPQEESEESQQRERPAETKASAAGKSCVKFIIYTAVIIVLAVLMYIITNYNSNTFKINM